MPLDASAVGRSLGSIDVTYDDRWLMAFAAGVPDAHPALYDTLHGVVAHPLFPVALEWSLLVAGRGEGTGLTRDELARGLHIGHDLRIDRPLRCGDRVTLTADIVGVGRLRSGATQHTRFTAVDDRGEMVWRTRFTNLYLGVDLVGDPIDVGDEVVPSSSPPESTDVAPLTQTSFVRPVDAHVYSECARIWNPIHTDVAAARTIGLHAPILHGTATLARSVSIAADLVGIDRIDIRRVAAKFRAPTELGTSITVRVLGSDDVHVWFDTRRADGSRAITDGLIEARPR